MDPLQRLAQIILFITDVQIDVRARKPNLLVPPTFEHVSVQLDLLSQDLGDLGYYDLAGTAKLINQAPATLYRELSALSFCEADKKLEEIRSPLLILQENIRHSLDATAFVR